VTDNESAHQGVASRRAVVGGFVGLGIGVPLLAACGSDSGSGGSSDGSGGSGDGTSSGGTTASGAIGKATDVPVGEAKIYTAEKVVVSQPTEGDFKAFSTICTHQQCPITKLQGDEIECTCHGSRFKTSDGSVVNGPANKPLAALKVAVENGEITVS
jgi:nitrite reductase/ring-hydroxylating ferredoxin subunit